jgi:hypothetical protein
MTHGCPTVHYEEEEFWMNYSSTISGTFSQGTHRDEIWQSRDPNGTAFWGGQVVQSREGAVIEAIHDSLYIGPNTFTDVTQIYTNVGAVGESGIYRLYYCPSIGIVRKEIMWGTSVHNRYDLVEGHVRAYP